MTAPVRALIAFVMCAAWFACGGVARAQGTYLGPSSCVSKCHADEKEWWERRDGTPPKRHINALNEMANRKAPDLAKAIGLKDPYDPKGACVVCHATVFPDEANAGVSCESCHGAGRGYLEVHQQKDAYAQAVAAGLTDLKGNLTAWAPLCMSCHVVDDTRLIKAGHPSGDDFELGAKFGIVALHWKTRYERGTVAAAGREATAPRVALRARTPPAPPIEAAPPPAPPPGPAKAAEDKPKEEPPAPAVPTSPAAPVAPAAPAPRPARALPPAAVGLPTNPAVVVSPPVVVPQSGQVLSSAPLPPLPRSPADAVAEVQGRAIELLTGLLERGARAPARVKPPERITPYRGANAALLALHEELIALAIEALGAAPQPAKK